jgi:hypothetical protein
MDELLGGAAGALAAAREPPGLSARYPPLACQLSL